MHHVFGFVEFYLTPFIFAIGLIYFSYGIINYFIIGPNFEEDRREMGRQSLLWAMLMFFVGLVLFGISHWLFSISNEIKESIDADVDSSFDTLYVPNVPGL